MTYDIEAEPSKSADTVNRSSVQTELDQLEKVISDNQEREISG